MSTNDLLERRAERGHPRGAANVWADAQPVAASGPTGGVWVFRLTVGLAVMIMAVGGFLAIRDSSDLDTAQVDPDADVDAPQPTSEDPLPAPILVEGMTLEMVQRPFDPDFDGDDIFDDLGFVREEPEVVRIGEDRSGAYGVVFADRDDPYNEPIFGLDLFDDGGFRPWLVNAGDQDVADYTGQLEQVDGEWTLPASSGLVEVARFSNDPFELMKFGWQFDFHDGDERVILQAETSREGTSVDEWLWISRLQDSDVELTFTEVDVLGSPGLRIVTNDFYDEVVWTSDDFVYRLGGSIIDDNTANARPASGSIERLTVVDRATWVQAVNNAGPGSGQFIWVVGLALVLILILGLFAALSLRRVSQRDER